GRRLRSGQAGRGRGDRVQTQHGIGSVGTLPWRPGSSSHLRLSERRRPPPVQRRDELPLPARVSALDRLPRVGNLDHLRGSLAGCARAAGGVTLTTGNAGTGERGNATPQLNEQLACAKRQLESAASFPLDRILAQS